MNILRNHPLAPLSTLRIGGGADYFVELRAPSDFAALAEILQAEPLRKLPRVLLGGGSNLVFADAGLRGVVIKINCEQLTTDDKGSFVCAAGVKNIALYNAARAAGYDASIFYTIPGTVGGAVAGNAGLPSGAMADYLQSVEVWGLPQCDGDRELLASHGIVPFQATTLPASALMLRYRHTLWHDESRLRQILLVASAALKLPAADSADIAASASATLAHRKATQPWGQTGGSFFKNPATGKAAGAVLDQAGAQSLRIGGAYFSDKHANFLMSDGSATQADVLALGRAAKQLVAEQFDIELYNEVILLDEMGEVIAV